jgi:DNA-binding GntR family transcriptional regulator
MLKDEHKLRQPKRRLLRTEAAEILREAILAAHLVQGQKLNEKQLSEELGISRGPLREAFRCLEQEGLVHSAPYRGTFVVQVTTQDVIDMLTLRELVEPFAMERALQASPMLAQSLEKLVSQMHRCAAADDRVGVAKAHTQFHGLFYLNAGNRFLRLMWDRLEAPLQLYLLVHQTTFESLTDVAHAHERLVELVTTGDSLELEQEIHKHFHVNLDMLMAFLKEKGEEEVS